MTSKFAFCHSWLPRVKTISHGAFTASLGFPSFIVFQPLYRPAVFAVVWNLAHQSREPRQNPGWFAPRPRRLFTTASQLFTDTPARKGRRAIYPCLFLSPTSPPHPTDPPPPPPPHPHPPPTPPPPPPTPRPQTRDHSPGPNPHDRSPHAL